MTPAPAAADDPADGPDRAVIDIGSNTVRLVIYSGSRRAPEVWLNEKVAAKLGRDLATTGMLPDKATQAALKALARYAALVADLGIPHVHTVATAAVREAGDGPAFLDQVRALGLSPRLLSGEEEAFGAAHGVIGAFPDAQGTVADLGGGSLELVTIEGGACHDGASLPLGTLRLPALRARGGAPFRKAVKKELARAGRAAAYPGPLYMVGGAWRALAVFALRHGKYPLTDPHAFALPRSDAEALARRVARMDPARLAAVPGVPGSRAATLPDAAAMLRVMLSELRPDGLVFSSWGLREGLLFQQLPPAARERDPLLAAVAHFSAPRGGPLALARAIAVWTAPASSDAAPGDERLRLAATMLALAAAHVEPNHRARHAYEWAMDKRWAALDPAGRARMAAALLASCGKGPPPHELERLAPQDALREASAWGMAIRLCHRLGAGSRASLACSRLDRDGGRLALAVDPGRAQLVSDAVLADHRALAETLGLEPELRIGEIAPRPAM